MGNQNLKIDNNILKFLVSSTFNKEILIDSVEIIKCVTTINNRLEIHFETSANLSSGKWASVPNWVNVSYEQYRMAKNRFRKEKIKNFLEDG